MDERRKEPRSRSLLSGVISFNEGRSSTGCAVRNLSEHGAMVVHSELFRMPGEFALAIPHRDEKHHARMIWRKGETAGLALSPCAEAPAKAKRSQMKIWLQGSHKPARRGITLGY
jgi:hypothetical protein